MASQEDYLDELLKGLADSVPEMEDLPEMPDATDMPGITEMPEVTDMPEITDIPETTDTPETTEIPEHAEMSEITDMPDLSEAFEMTPQEEESGMSEEEIDRLLQANQQGDAPEKQSSVGNGEDDLMSLLENADDSDLLDIHDMLQKSDNNEAVDEDVIALLQGISDDAKDSSAAEGLEQAEGLPEMEDLNEMSEREKRAQEKKRLKEEKAAAKKAAKEAKKAEKLAKKAAKQQENKSENAVESSEPQNSEEKSIDDFLESLDEFTPEGSKDGSTAETTDNLILKETETGDLQETPDGSVTGAAENPAETEMDDIEELLGIANKMENSGESADEETDGIENIAEETPKAKKGFFARIIDLLTEEDEEDEETEKGTEDIPLSDENRNILEELDQEEKDKKGKKGKKPKKSQKDKKAKDAKGDEGDGEDEETGDDKKSKKGAKPKKEKKPKEKEPVAPGNRISIKKLAPVALICLSILLAILILVNLGGDFTVKQEAKKAFYQEDYETCYQNLYGRSLNETEQVMLGKSESVLRIRLWMREYELFVEEGSETEALDILIQAVNDYAALYDYAAQWNAESLISETYEQMLSILSDKYGLTESQALEIAAEPDDVEYTRKVTDVAEGRGYASSETEDVPLEVQLPDMLPEEQQFPENNGG
jgi:hypothetical protein